MMKLKEILLEQSIEIGYIKQADNMIKLKSLLVEQTFGPPIYNGKKIGIDRAKRKFKKNKFIQSDSFSAQGDAVKKVTVKIGDAANEKDVINYLTGRANLKSVIGRSSEFPWRIIIPNEITGRISSVLIMILNDTYKELVNNGDISVAWDNEFATLEDWEKAVNIYEKTKAGKEASEKEKAANKKYWQDWFKDLKDEPYKLGNRSSQIEKIYKLLGITPTQSVFTKGLVVALKAWQKENRLTVTGEWDQDTRDKFYEKYKDGDWHPDEFDPDDKKHVVVPVTPGNANDDDITIDKGVPPIPFRNKAEGNAFRKWVNDNYQQWAQDNDLSRTGDWKKGQENFKDYMLNAWNKFGKEYIDGNNYKKIKQKNVVKQKDNSITF